MGDEQSRAGIRYASPQIVDYVDRVHVGVDDSVMKAFDAPKYNDMPPIMVGHSEAQLLSLILQLHGARKVIEVGTLAGFSAIHMGRAIGSNGHLWTIENEAQHAHVARQHILEAGLDDRITVLEADGLDGLDALTEEGPFDAIFLDADKERYDQYALKAHDILRPGGVFMADNAYYFGLLMADTDEAVAVRRMHEFIALNYDSVCVPTPDGLVVAIKR